MVDPKIVVIGGGTGSFTVLSGLKHYTRNITALVSMADDGGSTGTLRDELGVLPPGDVRQCLVALSNVPRMRDLFNYRFGDGGLRGHAFGNLFLTALEKMTGNFAEGVELASQVLRITGRVEPITLTNVKLCMKTSDGLVTRGEFEIGQADFSQVRPEMWLEPEAVLNPTAVAAIADADMVVIAPGNIYGSLAPALIVPGIGEALQQSHAKKVYICNLMTKPGQTDGFGVHDYAAEIERLVGGPFLDCVLYNTEVPSAVLVEKYAHEGEKSVVIDAERLQKAPYEAVGIDMISDEIHEADGESDPIAHARTFIRHDSEKVAHELIKLL